MNEKVKKVVDILLSEANKKCFFYNRILGEIKSSIKVGDRIQVFSNAPEPLYAKVLSLHEETLDIEFENGDKDTIKYITDSGYPNFVKV